MKWHTYLSRYCFVEGTSVAVDIAHQMYFADVVDLAKRDPDQLQILSNKAMEVVWKEHMMGFHKRLPMCDPSLGPSFF